MGMLDGRVALVTGGGSGLGRATSRCLAEAGAHVLIADVDVDGAKATAEQIHELSTPGTCEAVSLDVTDRRAVDQVVEDAASRFGAAFDLLVNNAGTDRGSDLVDIDDEEWHGVFAVNVDGPMYLTRAFVRHRLTLGETGSKDEDGADTVADVVCVVSISALTVGAGAAAYNSSKAALLKFAEVMQTEARERSWPVRVTALNPAAMATPMMDQWGLPPERTMDPMTVAGLIRYAAALPTDSYLQSAVIELRNEGYPR